MLHEKLFEKFILEELKINNSVLNFYWIWKDNITCLVKYEWWNFVIQQNNNISDIQMELIDEVIDFWSNNWLILAWKKFKKRFYEFEWKKFQVMDLLIWKNINYEEFNIFELEKIISYIAGFHNIYDKWNFSKFKKSTNKFKDLFYFIDLAKEYNQKNNKNELLLNKIIKLSDWLKTVDW